MGFDHGRFHVVDGVDGAAVRGDLLHLGAGAVDQFGDERVHHDRALEDVAVFEQVGLVGEDLLQPQRPLLIPRARQPERLVPGRQLQRAGARVAAERDRQRLERDPVHVVLRLRLGQPQRVDLHAVAEPQLTLVADAVALTAELLPQPRHRAQLRVLLDEPHAGVDEERDPAKDLWHQRLGPLAETLGDRVQHRDRVADRIGGLLHRRRAGLLQVVGADVDRVPPRHVLDRVDDRVGDQAQRRRRRERVGAAAQVLLQDVVLRGALQQRLLDTLVLGRDDVERQQPRRRRVDRHRRVHPVQRNPVEQRRHITAMCDRDTDLADLTTRELVIGVITRLRRQIERDRQARLPLLQVAPIQLVGAASIGMTRIGPNHPRAIRLREARRARIRHQNSNCMGALQAVYAVCGGLCGHTLIPGSQRIAFTR